jgi:N-acetylglucosaminyl-diphospho-decaprenol L-rhamnosyltransferase
MTDQERRESPAEPTASTDINHVLLTRFNLPSAGAESRIRAQNGWLTARMDLFERYCLPSVAAQGNRNFSWIVYLDPESPTWLLERMQKYEADGVLTPIYRARVDRTELLADIRATQDRQRAVLLTTNLDNDDGLAADFVDRLQQVATPHPRAAVYLRNGLITSPGGLFLRRDRRNAFCSVRESWNDPVTCWSDWHNLLGRSMPVIELGGAPGWLQVVHGNNVSNRVRGRLVAAARFEPHFGALLAGAQTPTVRRFLQDRLVAGPARRARDAFRTAAKWTAMRFLGKAGLDRVKLGLADLARSPRSRD